MATATAQVEKVERKLEEASLEEQWPAGLNENVGILDGEEVSLARMLLSLRQAHLFSHWPPPGTDDDKKHAFFDQVRRLDGSYPHGLAGYVENARQLLRDSREGKNPFEGFTPSVPSGVRLSFGDDLFNSLEQRGVQEAGRAAFVLVAGGLGERLGYSGIKVSLPSESTTGRCFLQLYIDSILALQRASNRVNGTSFTIPFVIMTSDDTHGRTQQLLETNNMFGMEPGQITLLKQEKVACLADNEASLALDPKDPFQMQTKPHGHGDVHMLLHSSNLLPKWQQGEVKWVLFFQDTNGLLFKAIPSSLGVSASHDLDVNSLAVPRRAKEAIGGIARLTHHDGRSMVINVEYNQLDPLLRATINSEGDVNDEQTGYSPFPGNINQIVLKLDPYIKELEKTKGVIAEFVNPKYKDSTKASFKSSTRLECMMQDYPKTLGPSAKVGFTVVDVWLGYSPVKNNPADAAVKMKSGTPPHSSTSGEMDIYRAHCLILRKAGVEIEDPHAAVFAGQPVEVWPRVVWSPKWAVTFADVVEKVKSGTCKISQRSTLIIDGEQIFLEGLTLDGALQLNAIDGAKLVVESLHVENDGWSLEPINDDTNLEEAIKIRGFVVKKHDCRVDLLEERAERRISN